MQLKSPINKMTPDDPPGRNTLSHSQMPPSSSGGVKRYPTKPAVPSDSTNPNHAADSTTVPSSSWMSSLRRISSTF
ncbi:hypothetical protein L1987_30067 [Smallanthus sonchifolius]|uniref:Uncharacterized protein n=1 Tax=Smallanthus sonchifolius TaxID=185202 RepID=A0ACB9I2Z6_9ASTR|nr:hypothetical protein L1987_30067 [Smallanthus sonchifolius]